MNLQQEALDVLREINRGVGQFRLVVHRFDSLNAVDTLGELKNLNESLWELLGELGA